MCMHLGGDCLSRCRLGFIRDISALYWAQYSHTISFTNSHFYLVIMYIQRVYYVHFEFKIQNVQSCMWECVFWKEWCVWMNSLDCKNYKLNLTVTVKTKITTGCWLQHPELSEGQPPLRTAAYQLLHTHIIPSPDGARYGALTDEGRTANVVSLVFIILVACEKFFKADFFMLEFIIHFLRYVYIFLVNKTFRGICKNFESLVRKRNQKSS